MKTSFYLLLIILFSGIVFNSCSDEETIPQSSAAFTASKKKVIVGEAIQFTNTSSNATAFRWSFGDGTTSKDIAPKKAYETSGVFVVSLVSTGEGGSTISSTEITVLPSAAFVVEDDDNLLTLTAVKFTNNSKGAVSYLWSFGNPAKSTSTEASPEFTYLTAGTFTVSLTTKSPEGETTVTKEITLKAAPPEIYFVDVDDLLIKKLALDGSGTITNVLDVTGKTGPGLAYDEVHGKIYFTDYEVTGEGKIWRMNLDATGLEAIVEGIAEDPYGISLDVPGGKMYWADNGGTVSRANLDGTNKEDLVTTADFADAQYRCNVALDPSNNKMYFIDYWNENVYVANLDGSNASVLIHGVYGYGILVDTEHDKIYYDDQNSDELRRADLNGTNIETVDDVVTRIYGMAINYDTDKLYWSGSSAGEVNIADLDGSNKVVLKSGLSNPRGIFLRN